MSALTAIRVLPMLAMVLGLVWPAAGQAQNAAPRIALVNVEWVYAQSSARTGLEQQVKNFAESYEGAAREQEGKLQTEQQDLAGLQATLTEEAFNQRAQAFSERVNGFRRDVEQKRQRLLVAAQVARRSVNEKILALAKSVAEAQGYAYAMAMGPMLHYPESADISQEVLDRLNKELPQVDVPDPESLQLPSPSGAR